LAENLDRVAPRVRRLLAALQPSVIVGAAADGTDLLVLETALAIPNGPAVHLVLPTAPDVFREDSVDPEWQDRFAAVLDEVRSRGGVVDTLELTAGDSAYRRANQEFLDRALALSGAGERVVVVVVAGEGEGAMVQDLLGRAELKGVPGVRIDPTLDLARRPKCLVVMPYGKKPDPQRSMVLDCDQVYSKILVPALEHAQFDYRRADEEIDSGIVLEPMLAWLAEADLVIGDLETANFNVGWELGLRHLMRPGRTVLVGPSGTTLPFDVAALRHVRYQNDGGGVTDDAAIAAWGRLAPYLSVVDGQVPIDSPVASVMDVQWADVRRRAAPDDRWVTLRRELVLARDLSDADLMQGILAEAEAEDLPEEQRQVLRGEAGVGLVRLGRFSEAEPLLRGIVAADPTVQRPEAHLYLAQSLYRRKGATPADLDQAEQALRRVLVKRPSHPEVRALLGAIAKRRLQGEPDPEARRRFLTMALDSYRHDFERNLNLYYEGINVVAVGVALQLLYRDEVAGGHARGLLPAVRVAASLALNKPDERFWALATLAECALHDHLLGGDTVLDAVRVAYVRAGAEPHSEGFLDSPLTQLELLTGLGLPAVPLEQARLGLLAGAGRDH
jgi:hypothetical protein